MNNDRDSDMRMTFLKKDVNLPQRQELQRRLGLEDAPVPEFDELAARLSEAAAGIGNLNVMPYSMVNFMRENHQYFGGVAHLGRPAVGRMMARDHGWCPEVVDRESALILRDVRAAPRFTGNPVVNKLGILSYMGAPLTYDGVTFGTVCVVHTSVTEWGDYYGHKGLELIKQYAQEAVELIVHRAEINR